MSKYKTNSIKRTNNRLLLGAKTIFLLSLGLALTSVSNADIYRPSGFYLGLGLGGGNMDVGQLSVTNNPLNFELTTTNPSKSVQPGGYLTMGYGAKKLPLQFEIEPQAYLLPEYDQTDLSSDALVEYFDAKAYSVAVFGNINLVSHYQNLPVMPFLTAGIGIAGNLTVSEVTTNPNTSTGGQTIKKQTLSYGPAWQAGIGCYFKISNNLLINTTAVYQDLGEIQWGPLDRTTITNDKLTNEQVRVGLTYVFGDQHTPPSLIDNN